MHPLVEEQGIYTNNGYMDFQALADGIDTSKTSPKSSFWLAIGSSTFAKESADKAFYALKAEYNKRKNAPLVVFKCQLRGSVNSPVSQWPRCFVLDYQTTNTDSHIFAIYDTNDHLINTQLGEKLF